MGITIHFKRRLNNLQKVESVIDEFKDISEIMKWKWNSLNEDWNKPATARLSFSNNKAEITGHSTLSGLSTTLPPFLSFHQKVHDETIYYGTLI